jgi:enamine deaminase RidA (YjgF/YER057c/UK114 family)
MDHSSHPELEVNMSTSGQQPHAFNPPNVPTPPPTYNQVCITPILPTSKLITLAGQTGLQSDGSIAKDIETQAKEAYKAVHNCLQAAGVTPRDIIHVRHYIVKETGNPEEDSLEVVDRGWGPLWIEFMDREGGGHRPPDTVVGVASLAKKELLYEVEVWALVSR